MTDISAVPNEMEFIKYMLAKSPALEVMSIASSVYATDEKLRMLVGLLKFPRASPKQKSNLLRIRDLVLVDMQHETCRCSL